MIGGNYIPDEKVAINWTFLIKNWYLTILLCFWFVFKQRCIGHPKLSHIIRFLSQSKFEFFNKIGQLRGPWFELVTKSCFPKLREESGGMARAAVTLSLPLRAVVICTSPLMWIYLVNDNINISPLYYCRGARLGIWNSYHQMGLVSQNLKKSKNFS